jgi:hypothetical protein
MVQPTTKGGKQMKKKFRINEITSSIESFTYVSIHPENSNYCIVLDDFRNPQKITNILWDSMPYDNYDDARNALIKHLHEVIVFYTKQILKDKEEQP